MLLFDIGANIGKWALANITPGDSIIAVEASPITFSKLSASCNHPDITLVNYAICNNNGEDITFYQADCDTISTINKDWLTKDTMRFNNFGFKQITCKTMTMDNLIQLYGNPDLIKVDVEGGEYSCISSLSIKVPQLCFEWSSEVNDINFKCLDHLQTLGFKRFYLQFEDHYTFRPTEEQYCDIDTVKQQLGNTVPKQHWGMLWCI